MTALSAVLFKVILLTILCGEKCNSVSIFVTNTRNEVSHHNRNVLRHAPHKSIPVNRNLQHDLAIVQREHQARIQNLLTRLKSIEIPRQASLRQHLLSPRRLVRQAYPGYKPNLYPALPTPTNNNPYQSNPNHHFNQPPYNPQWQPGVVQNYSVPAYPGINPSHNNGYNYPGNQSPYNSNFVPYNPRPSAPLAPPPPNNSSFASRYPNSFPTNYNNTPGSQPYPGSPYVNNNYNPGYQPSHGFNNNTVAYNPSQRPPYYPQGNNSLSPYQPSYPSYTTQRHPVSYYNTTTPRIPTNYPNHYGKYNNSTPSFPNFGPNGVPRNNSYTNINYPRYSNVSSPNTPYGVYNHGQSYPGYTPSGYGSRPVVPNGYPNPPQNGSYNGSFNNYNRYPTGHNVNNYTNQHNQGRPAYPGSNNYVPPNQSYNPFGQANSTHQLNPNQGQMPGGFYPQNQYRGASTYRVADHYIPIIPSQPPAKNNFGGSNSFYPSHSTDDPTRVPPERFSY